MAITEESIRLSNHFSLYHRLTYHIARMCKCPLLLHSTISLLLGRAVILDAISPSAVAYIAALSLVFQRQFILVYICTIIGAFTVSTGQASYICIALLTFACLYYIGRKAVHHVTMTYIFVFFSICIPRVFLYSLLDPLTIYNGMQIVLEGLMGVILLFIFMQALPLLFQQQLLHPFMKSDEIICLVILLASVITGLNGLSIFDVDLEH